MAFGTPAEFWTMRLYNVIAGQNNRRSKPWTNGIRDQMGVRKEGALQGCG